MTLLFPHAGLPKVYVVAKASLSGFVQIYQIKIQGL